MGPGFYAKLGAATRRKENNFILKLEEYTDTGGWEIASIVKMLKRKMMFFLPGRGTQLSAQLFFFLSFIFINISEKKMFLLSHV